MTDEKRHALATEFVSRWFEPIDSDPADLHGYPQAMASREMLVMALGHMIDAAIVETQQERRGELTSLNRVIRMCLDGDGT